MPHSTGVQPREADVGGERQAEPRLRHDDVRRADDGLSGHGEAADPRAPTHAEDATQVMGQ